MPPHGNKTLTVLPGKSGASRRHLLRTGLPWLQASIAACALLSGDPTWLAAWQADTSSQRPRLTSLACSPSSLPECITSAEPQQLGGTLAQSQLRAIAAHTQSFGDIIAFPPFIGGINPYRRGPRSLRWIAENADRPFRTGGVQPWCGLMARRRTAGDRLGRRERHVPAGSFPSLKCSQLEPHEHR